MILSIVLAVIVVLLSVYCYFLTKRVFALYNIISSAEKMLEESDEVGVQCLGAVNKVYLTMDRISKYPVAENDANIQLIVKTINSARDELKGFVEGYKIEKE